MMKWISPASVIFSVRTYAAAMLALYLSYQLDLARPTWAFLTVYVVSAPYLGMGRSKGLYRIIGTLCGAAFSVATLPNLVDAPELFALTIACWIGGCLYLSIIDGTPRAYIFILAGFTTALISFPSVDVPQTIFDTAISRVEEIGMAIVCVQVMGYLPFNQRAGDALLARIDQWLVSARQWTTDILTSAPNDLQIKDRSQMMISAVQLDALRIHAHYDTKRFHFIEGWVIQLQRRIHGLFSHLVTLEAQMHALKTEDPATLALLKPIADSIVGWIKAGQIPVPQQLVEQLAAIPGDPAMQGLVRSGLFDTLSDLVACRSECMALRTNIANKVRTEHDELPLERYVDQRQSIIYGVSVVCVVMDMSFFWIYSRWPEGGIAAMFSAVVCCFFSSLEAPPKVVPLFLALLCVGGVFGWIYNFDIFPRIDGFPLFAFVLALSLIPIGLVMAKPAFTALVLPLILGINLASFQNRYDVDIAGFLNGFLAQALGLLAAGMALNFVRVYSLQGATRRLLIANGASLATLAATEKPDQRVLDHIAHRAGMAFTRAPALHEARQQVVNRILLDLQAGRALMQIKSLLPRATPELLASLRAIQEKLVIHFSKRQRLQQPSPMVCDEIRRLSETIEQQGDSHEALRLIGLMRTLNRGLQQEA